ncbi:MAG: AMP-binding protein [Synergistaceae bacterium]|nr:AMP-binding protein [Synergistaceae bacterium]
MRENFFDNLEQYGDRAALITESAEVVSYSELAGRADEIASGVPPRCVVFQMCRNDAESVAAYVGFLRRGAVPVLLDDSLDGVLLDALMDAYMPPFAFLPSSQTRGGDAIYGHGAYSLVRTGFGVGCDVNPELALLLSTSGSTGSPKLVRISHENIASNARSIIEYLKITPGDRAITTLPMSYTYGLSIVNTHLGAGASLVLTEKTMMEREFWNLLKEREATTFGGVPYTYEMLKKLRFGRMELPSLRYLTQAGGRLSPELCAEFIEIAERKGIEFIVMYGQTEATARMSYLPWERAKGKPGSMGIAIPGGEFWVVGGDGERILAPNRVGELMYRGKNVALGYAENRFDLAKGDERGGVLATGDMAYFDSDGFYYIAGRKKRFLKIYGNRVNLDEVEALLKNAGFDCACGGTDDALRIYTTAADLDALRKFVLERTSINPAGFSAARIENIPRNSSGKVLYSELERGR